MRSPRRLPIAAAKKPGVVIAFRMCAASIKEDSKQPAVRRERQNGTPFRVYLLSSLKYRFLFLDESFDGLAMIVGLPTMDMVCRFQIQTVLDVAA